MNISRFVNKENAIRVIIVLFIAVLYLMAIRPMRAYLAQEIIHPIAQPMIEENDRLRLEEHGRSVSFKIFIISTDEQRHDQELTFGFPFGFYLVFPLMLLVIFDKSNRFVIWHLIIHSVLGIFMVAFFFAGIGIHIFFLHLYKLTMAYLIPGAAFLLILFVLLKDRNLLNSAES